jgi:hypothetical protein
MCLLFNNIFKSNMKYLSIKTIKVALHRILDGNCTMEHRTATAADSLVHHYFPLQKFTCTLEQTQPFSNKRPDISIERLEGEELVHYCFVEYKGLENSNFNSILDQLHDTILETVDFQGGSFSVFIIAMKGVKIAFYQFYSFESLLDEYNVQHYRGFVPLNKLMSAYQYFDINDKRSLIDYLKYISKYSVPTNVRELERIGGVESGEDID